MLRALEEGPVTATENFPLCHWVPDQHKEIDLEMCLLWLRSFLSSIILSYIDWEIQIVLRWGHSKWLSTVVQLKSQQNERLFINCWTPNRVHFEADVSNTGLFSSNGNKLLIYKNMAWKFALKTKIECFKLNVIHSIYFTCPKPW